MANFPAPRTGQPIGHNLAVTDVHIGATAHQDDRLARGGNFPQPLLAGGEVGNLDLLERALEIPVAKLLEPDVTVA